MNSFGYILNFLHWKITFPISIKLRIFSSIMTYFKKSKPNFKVFCAFVHKMGELQLKILKMQTLLFKK